MKIKKLLTRSLSIALVSAALTSLCAFPTNAETNDIKNNDLASQAITLNQAASSDATVYSVDVVWTDVCFKYTPGSQTWDPSTHTYITTGESKWDDNSASVTVANHSNTSIGVKVDFEQSSPQNGSATVTVNNPQFTLDSATSSSTLDIPSKVTTLTASGTPTSNASIGKVKVTIN